MEEPYIIDADTEEEVESQMKQALEGIDDIKNGVNTQGAQVTFRNGNGIAGAGVTTGQNTNIENGGVAAAEITEEYGEFALIINGHSLVNQL